VCTKKAFQFLKMIVVSMSQYTAKNSETISVFFSKISFSENEGENAHFEKKSNFGETDIFFLTIFPSVDIISYHVALFDC